ncbi:transcription initiation factor IIB 2 [halophilic archaeon]|nr:transcription initiation factor IIB 2 [halophilic archaeon]
MTNTQLNIEDGHTNERQSVTESQLHSSCPECDGAAIHDDEHGETTCEECGLVLDEGSIDRGPEWRAFHSDEKDEKSRVGAPTTELMHDKGLSTTISWQNKDAYGQAVSNRKRTRLQRLRTWDERFRTKDAHERNLKQALGEIRRMASALDVPSPVRETAGVLYRRTVDENLLPGRSIEGMATASLYAAAKQHGTPRPLSKFAEVSRVEKIRIQRAYRYISRELELEIEPTNPQEYVPQFASALDVSDEATRQARDLLTTAKAQGVLSGKSPAGLAAAAIYAATHLTNEQLTQETVSNVAHISKVTIRDRYQELLDVYAEEEGYV